MGFPSFISEHYFFTFTEIKTKVVYDCPVLFFSSEILVSTLEDGILLDKINVKKTLQFDK